MPWLSPYLVVKDPAAALDFYQRAFGFQKKEVYPDANGGIGHAEVTWNEAVIMFGPECTVDGEAKKAPVTLGVPSPVGMYVYCDDVDALCTQARAAGAAVVRPPQTMFWGDRMCTVTDPDGHVWSFATFVGNGEGAQACH
jgi:PhnB protein